MLGVGNTLSYPHTYSVKYLRTYPKCIISFIVGRSNAITHTSLINFIFLIEYGFENHTKQFGDNHV